MGHTAVLLYMYEDDDKMFERIYDDNTRLVRLFGILTSFLNPALATQCLFVFKFATPVAERLGALDHLTAVFEPCTGHM